MKKQRKKYKEKNSGKEERFEFTKDMRQKIRMVPFLEWMRVKRQRLYGWGILYAILLGILVTQIKLIHLNSESIPYRYCVQLNHIEPEKGDLCVFDYKAYKFVKYLVGTKGDHVKRIDNKIYINGEFICEVKHDNGLTPIDDIVIPDGFIFVMGTHADSLDSRYKEFGLVKVSSLKGKAIGWLEW